MNSLLGKLNDAINFCEYENELEIEVPLTYSELLLLRKYELTDEYSRQLSAENIKKGRDFKIK